MKSSVKQYILTAHPLLELVMLTLWTGNRVCSRGWQTSLQIDIPVVLYNCTLEL